MAAYLGLGSNLGNRRANLVRALQLLEPLAHIDAVSALYESPPQPPAPPPNYLNAACRVITDLSPIELLRHAKRIETQMGRQEGPRWSPRPIDIDIELYDQQIIETDELVVPHPRLVERAFVLQPLLDIDPELRHPVTGERLDEILRRIGLDDLRLIKESGWTA